MRQRGKGDTLTAENPWIEVIFKEEREDKVLKRNAEPEVEEMLWVIVNGCQLLPVVCCGRLGDVELLRRGEWTDVEPCRSLQLNEQTFETAGYDIEKGWHCSKLDTKPTDTPI